MIRDLLVYLGVGHDAINNIKVIVEVVMIIVGMPTITFLLLMTKRSWETPSHIRERNYQASLLARKVNRKKNLTPGEQTRFNSFVRDGVLSCNLVGLGHSPKAQLSDRVLKETFGS